MSAHASGAPAVLVFLFRRTSSSHGGVVVLLTVVLSMWLGFRSRQLLCPVRFRPLARLARLPRLLHLLRRLASLEGLPSVAMLDWTGLLTLLLLAFRSSICVMAARSVPPLSVPLAFAMRP